MTETEPQESGDNYRVESGSRVGSAFMVSVDTDWEGGRSSVSCSRREKWLQRVTESRRR